MARLIAAFIVATLCAVNCLADTVTFTGSDGDGPLNASATITISGNIATVVLQNLESNSGATGEMGAGQLISGFGFTVMNGNTTLTETGVVSKTGVERTLASDGDGDESYTDGTVTAIAWSVQNSQNTPASTDCKHLVGIQLCALTGGSPDLMIIGPPLADGDYNVNSSTFPHHQPDLAPGSTTFVITLSGTGGTVTAANFDFGTGSDFTSGTLYPTPTPEPRWGALLLTLVGGLAAFGARRFKSART